MKWNLIRTITLAATMVSGSMAMVQDLTATVDFPFSAPGVDLPAGKYSIQRDYIGSQGVFHLRNTKTMKSVMVLSMGASAQSERSNSIQFRCTENACKLAAINANGLRFEFPGIVKAKKNERVALITVPADVQPAVDTRAE